MCTWAFGNDLWFNCHSNLSNNLMLKGSNTSYLLIRHLQSEWALRKSLRSHRITALKDTSGKLCIQKGQSEENMKVSFWQQVKWTLETDVTTEVGGCT